ncbi:MAG: tetratricopeptide repeat protein, partial [Acidobacteriota bacterium]
LRRGLDADPDRRWPSMEALILACEEQLRGPRIRRRRIAAVGLALAAGAGVLWYALDPRGARCGDSQEQLQGLWDADRRDRLKSAFAASDARYAEATWRRIDSALDVYSQEWIRLRDRLCQSHGDGGLSDLLHDRQHACLRQSRAALASLVDILEEGDPMVIRNAVRAAADLPQLERCADAEMLLAAVAPPEDPPLARRVETGRDQLLRVETLASAGMTRRASEHLAEVLPGILEIPYPPLQAEARYRKGIDLATEYRLDEAKTSFTEAWEIALEVNHHRIAYSAALRLMQLLGNQQGHFEEAEIWASSARALAHKFDDEPRAESRYLGAMGLLAQRRGEPRAALDYYRRSLELLLEGEALDSLPVAGAYSDLGNAHATLGQWHEALEAHEIAHASRRQHYGEDHPLTAGSLVNLSTAYNAVGRLQDERGALLEALDILRAAYGENHVRVGYALVNLGLSFTEDPGADLRRARESIEEAHRVLQSNFGDVHLDVGRTLNNLAKVLLSTGDVQTAERHARASLAIFDRLELNEHPSRASALGTLGRALLMRNDVQVAVPVLEEALALL